MPRWGEWVTMPGGGVAHVLYGGRKPRHRCACGRSASLQCDYPTLFGETCDAHICPGCAVSIGPDIDYCRSHGGESR